ncbi:tyrosine--tRNA ligase, mitochondrial [Phlebotomus argentipes]|uniref:tyrosine--tRNA ligase, mitochondrial n=1 Tax=Phlebotomus argentipes TaxID=94469 RepID=UPI002892D7A6|nr:tyrosine--tRNA ligase, mitochondrial [Phlebotomus argentipes]
MLKNILKSNIKVYQSLFCRGKADRNVLKLMDREIIQDIFPDTASDDMRNKFTKETQTLYAGFDPTAESLHVGNLLVIMGLLHCQRKGHQAIALLGGATGMIGDPSGRSTERSLLDVATVEKNLSSIGKQIESVFENHAKYFWNGDQERLLSPKILNNADWYRSVNLVDFISTIGRHFRMGSMLSRSSVQARLNSDAGMSFTEFTYQMFQAYDWLHLLKEHNCRFQLGGGDQMGNLKSGHDLIGRMDKRHVYGIMLPIVTNEEGDKYGKSGGNAIWLDPQKTSPFAFYQFFLRTRDADVERLLKLFTFVPLRKIKELMDRHRNVPEVREAQKKLAQEVTLLIHGEEGVKTAENVSEALYGGNINTLGELSYSDVKTTFQGATVTELIMEPGLSVLDVAMKAECFSSKEDAMRIITAGGFRINNQRTTNIAEVLSPGIHILKNGITLLRVGKKNYYVVKWV